MTVTPATYRPVWAESLALPTDIQYRPLLTRIGPVEVTDSAINWTQAKTSVSEFTEEDLTRGTDTLLDEFMALASGDPEDMGAFMGRYGVLELCGDHGRPDGHPDDGFCPFLEVDGRLGVSARHIRRASRAFADLAAWGKAVKLGVKGDPRRGIATQELLPGILTGDVVTDRDRIAHYLTEFNRQTGVRPLVTWERRLSFTFAAGGLLGVLGILLTREIAARSELTYTCSACGALVDRMRPPQPDEAIYCPKQPCKTEQRRRNQAAWRARKRAEGKT